eukprot:NODE_82_length_22708_cov_0.383476.p7 type:complete len:247 gc:universal NODE_82_length_22708_cov_0.383476:3361-4101(+)
MTKFRPCIDLHDGKVKQIIGSTLMDSSMETNYIADKPSTHYAELYRKYKLTGGHCIMLGPNNEKSCMEAIRVHPMQVGGGIDIDNCIGWISSGATHVIVTSYLFENGVFELNRLVKMASLIGKDRIVVDLSCKLINNEYRVAINKWQTITDLVLSREVIKEIEQHCDELLVHATHVEGKQSGMDFELIRCLAEWCDIPVTYAGGARSIEDIDKCKQISKGKVDVTIGSALDIFGGKLSFEAVANYS